MICVDGEVDHTKQQFRGKDTACGLVKLCSYGLDKEAAKGENVADDARNDHSTNAGKSDADQFQDRSTSAAYGDNVMEGMCTELHGGGTGQSGDHNNQEGRLQVRCT